MMGYFILESALFILGLAAFFFGRVPVTRKRSVKGSAARFVGVILMVPLPLYLFACKQSNLAPLELGGRSLDPLHPFTEGFVKLAALAGAFGSVLAATVLAIIASEPPRRP